MANTFVTYADTLDCFEAQEGLRVRVSSLGGWNIDDIAFLEEIVIGKQKGSHTCTTLFDRCTHPQIVSLGGIKRVLYAH